MLLLSDQVDPQLVHDSSTLSHPFNSSPHVTDGDEDSSGVSRALNFTVSFPTSMLAASAESTIATAPEKEKEKGKEREGVD